MSDRTNRRSLCMMNITCCYWPYFLSCDDGWGHCHHIERNLFSSSTFVDNFAFKTVTSQSICCGNLSRMKFSIEMLILLTCSGSISVSVTPEFLNVKGVDPSSSTMTPEERNGKCKNNHTKIDLFILIYFIVANFSLTWVKFSQSSLSCDLKIPLVRRPPAWTALASLRTSVPIMTARRTALVRQDSASAVSVKKCHSSK